MKRSRPTLNAGERGATAALAGLASGIHWGGIPSDVKEKAKQAVTDAVACGVAGSSTPVAELVRKALGTPGPQESALLGTHHGTTALMAAHHNALAINVLDYDDQAPLGGHPGAAVVAATLATAEKYRASGSDVLQAIVAGYEVTMRVQAAVRPSASHYQHVHGNGTPLAMGVAASVGRLLGFDAPTMKRAFGIAAALSPVPHAGKFGWDEPTLPWIKDNVAWPAEAGVRAAVLAEAGMPASTTVLDGDNGFWRMAASDHCEWDVLHDQESFYLRQLAFKPYPCCRWLHTMLDALEKLLNQREIPPDAIQSIEVATTRQVSSQFGNPTPASMIDAEFSAPYAIASLVLRIPRSMWWNVQEVGSDSHHHRLAAATRLTEDAQLTAQHERLNRSSNRVPARVAILFDDGERVTLESDHAPGSADYPFANRASLAQKAQELLETRYAANTARAIRHRIDTLDQHDDFTSLPTYLKAHLQPDSHPSSPKHPFRKDRS